MGVSSYVVNPLRSDGLMTTVLTVSGLNSRVRQRLREEMNKNDLSQQSVADLLRWTQSRVAQKLTGRTPITVDELEALCFAIGISPTEMVRDRGVEFCAEMSPTELRCLENLRTIPADERDAIYVLLRAKTTEIQRHARPLPEKKIPKGRGRG